MFNKTTTFYVLKDGIEVLDGDMIKTAALSLPDGIEYDPDFFYLKVKAVSAGEYWGANKNADYFPEEELKKSYKTFLTAHTFKNHENKDIANAIGDVLQSEWDESMKCVILLLRIDKRIAPTIVRGFEKGFMTDVSMGCRIEYSICSICGNKAKTKFDYCDHIKFEKHKIYPDGRKVYEINIGPKFHDISAVLNGAERTAKVQGMFIDAGKVAFTMPDNTLEKVASIQESLEVFDEVQSHHKEANTIINDDLDIFLENKLSKTAYVNKIAEIKKEIQGKIVGLAEGEFINDRYEKANELFKVIKLLYEKYWDKDKCKYIASKIKEIATERDMPLEAAFEQFLQVLDFAGIELSPLETHDIFHSLLGIDTPDLRDVPVNPVEDCGAFMDGIDNDIAENGAVGDLNFKSLISTLTGIAPNMGVLANRLAPTNPLGQMKAIIIKVRKGAPGASEDVHNEMMNRVVGDLMPERSFHRRFLVKRLNHIADDSVQPNPRNIVHFSPVRMMRKGIVKHASTLAPFVLSGILHSAYENERVAHLMSDDYEVGLQKFASYIEGDSMDNILNEFTIEKSAGLGKVISRATLGKGYTMRKGLLYGLPLTYGYSALQRSRINNGDNVSGFNRYVAENPGNAALMQAALGPMAVNGVKSLAGKGTGKVKQLGKFVKSFGEESSKVAFDELSEYAFSKTAAAETYLYNENMFEDRDIDNELGKQYDGKQITALKYASVLSAMDRQDLADQSLAQFKLAEEDVNNYLQISKDCIRMKIEKQAGLTRDVALNAAGDMMFAPLGSSAIATLPGNLIDGFVMSKLTNKLSEGSEKAAPTAQKVKSSVKADKLIK